MLAISYIDICCSFILSNPTGSKFTFYPEEGALHPGESQILGIVFESDVLGEFSEFFRFSLQGNEHMLSCHIKGHVIGPTFHFDCEKIDFGSVSFDYLHTRVVRLANTSSVPVVFNLHIPQDGMHNREEFDIVPHRGTLLSGTDIHVLCACACVCVCVLLAIGLAQTARSPLYSSST